MSDIYEDEVNQCPECSGELHWRMIDVDGTNLEEMEVCEECGYGYPADYEDEDDDSDICEYCGLDYDDCECDEWKLKVFGYVFALFIMYLSGWYGTKWFGAPLDLGPEKWYNVFSCIFMGVIYFPIFAGIVGIFCFLLAMTFGVSFNVKK